MAVRKTRTRRPNPESKGSVQINVRIPSEVHRKLRVKAAEEDCSMAWLVTDALLVMFGLPRDYLEAVRGTGIPKTFTERRENPEWSPKTKASKEAAAQDKYAQYGRPAASEEARRRLPPNDPGQYAPEDRRQLIWDRDGVPYRHIPGHPDEYSEETKAKLRADTAEWQQEARARGDKRQNPGVGWYRDPASAHLKGHTIPPVGAPPHPDLEEGWYFDHEVNFAYRYDRR